MGSSGDGVGITRGVRSVSFLYRKNLCHNKCDKVCVCFSCCVIYGHKGSVVIV